MQAPLRSKFARATLMIAGLCSLLIASVTAQDATTFRTALPRVRPTVDVRLRRRQACMFVIRRDRRDSSLRRRCKTLC